jgi:hypothetical protein
MRKPSWLLGAVVVAGAVVAGAPAAEARLLDLHAGVDTGGIVGWGATSNTPDFFRETSGGAFGFSLGAKLLVFDLSASFLQVFNGSGTVGTLTQFLLGFEIDVPVGQDKMPNGRTRAVVRPALAGGFGFGTSGPVDPPLDNAQVSDKGVVTHFKVGYEYFLNPFMGVGVSGLAGYHYFLGGQVITNNQDHSSGYHLAALASFTFHLGI